MEQHINGALVIAAQSPVRPIYLFENAAQGMHVEGRHRGQWFTQTEGDTVNMEVAVPHRDKLYRLDVARAHSRVASTLRESLGQVDSQYKGERQRVKTQRLLDIINEPFVACANNIGEHGAIHLLAHTHPLYVLGVVDVQDRNVQLMWSTRPDLEYELRHRYPLRFVFYRMPTLVNSTLFLYTQSLVSRWWTYSKTFKGREDKSMMMFNALELRLFKNVE